MALESQGRLPGRRPVSIIDIGSNSIRLVVYEGIARSPTVLFNEKMLAGLGRGIVTTGRLDPEGVKRAVEEFRRFRALSEQAGAEQLHVIATAAAREAVNGPEFIRSAEAILGCRIRVLTGREEAFYAALGIISGFHRPDGIVGDLGGGSLELVDLRGEEIGDGVTLPLGGLRVQDMSKGSMAEAQKIARAELERTRLLDQGAGRTFYAVGGTWRNLARLHMTSIDYPLHVMHGYTMDPDGVSGFLRQVARGEFDKIRGIERISRSRRALLGHGAMLLQEIARVMKPARIVVSATGVREGFLHSLLDMEAQAEDPLISATEELAVLRSRSVRHAHELAEWTGATLAEFGIEETEDEARYRRASCLLADIGWRAHPEYRGIQSLNIIAHASFVGIDHPGRVFVALVNLFRHEGVFDDTLLPEMRDLVSPRYLERARLLGAMMRVVYLLTASMPGVMPRLRWERRPDGGLTLVVPASHAGLLGERPDGRIAQLSKLAGLKLSLRAASA